MATPAPATATTKNTQTDENPVKVAETVPAALNPTASSTHKPPISTSDMKDDKYEETKASTGDPVVAVVNNGSKNNKSENDGASVTDTQKKIRRAERFGMAVQLSEEEKRNSRAERFGIPGSQDSDATKKAQELKMKARAERFGMSTDEDEKKKARLARFASASSADPLEEQKKKARTLRFSGTQVNGSGKIELKTTIVGKAGGHA